MIHKHATALGRLSQLQRSIMSSASKHYNVVIIGSGQSGSPLATAFAGAGKSTALIESQHMGGCCVNEGCTPTKTMIASGRVAYLARRGPKDYGVLPGGDKQIDIDMEKVRQRKRDIVNQFRGGSERRVTNVKGLDVFNGTASFTSEKALRVSLNDGGSADVEGDLIVINVGERPAKPNVPGLEVVNPARVLDSTSVQELGQVPDHLIVVGGGYIGLEFGQLFRRLGAKVTIVQRGKQLLAREDADIAQTMLEILQQDGITVHLGTTVAKASKDESGGVIMLLTTASGTEQEVKGSHVLFAAGRTPNSDTLNVNAAGIKTGSRGHIITNDDLSTSSSGIYAIGDVKGGPAFTHVSYDDFRILQQNLIANPNPPAASVKSIKDRELRTPYVVYTDPQLGHVGLHEYEARSRYPDRSLKVAKMPMAHVARALETDETRGLMKAVVDATTGEILGFTCLGVEGGEIMSVVQTAMLGGLKYQDLQQAMFAHPTYAESLNNLWGSLQ